MHDSWRERSLIAHNLIATFEINDSLPLTKLLTLETLSSQIRRKG